MLTRQKKIIFFSDGGDGKSSYLWKIGEKYKMKQLEFEIPNVGNVKCYDSNTLDGNFNVIVLMCSTSIPDYDNIRHRYGDIPVMVLFNKFELKLVKQNYYSFIYSHPDACVRYCSVAKNLNVDETFQEIISLL
jgi:hypothetical protein